MNTNNRRRLLKVIPWALFSSFVLVAILSHDSEPLFFAEGPLAVGKPVFWLLFIGFLAYSIYCSQKENIFRTLNSIWPFHWARQIGLDLYLGVVIFCFFIYLVEGSLLIVVFWLLPILLFANLATLLYVALNYQTIVTFFVT